MLKQHVFGLIQRYSLALAVYLQVPSGIHWCRQGYSHIAHVRGCLRSVGMQRGWLDGLIMPSLELSNPIYPPRTHTHTVQQTYCKQLTDLCSFHSVASIAHQSETSPAWCSNLNYSLYSLLSLGWRVKFVYISEYFLRRLVRATDMSC